MRVLVTGPGGFAGRALVPVLRQSHEVREAGRHSSFAIADIGPQTDWRAALQGCDAVLHLAGMAHVPDRGDTSQEAQFHRVNADGSRRLAEQAAEAGVQRFILLSSATVMGLASPPGRAWTEQDIPQPENAYARSKLAAEQAGREVAGRSGMAAWCLRPPLMYGPGVKANFLRLMKLVTLGVPLPLASVQNRRDMLYIGNLADVVLRILDGTIPPETYFITDNAPVSTPDLLRKLTHALRRPSLLFPFPVPLLKRAATLLGLAGEVERLTSDFRLDTSALNAHWQPSFTTEDGLQGTAAWFHALRET
jgi:nucleoside-diphosphate-sugar epimerase